MKEYFKVSNRVFNLKLTLSELVILIYIYRCSNNSKAFPSYSTIAKNCHISRRTAIRVILSLESKNIIQIDRTNRKANRYLVTL